MSVCKGSPVDHKNLILNCYLNVNAIGYTVRWTQMHSPAEERLLYFVQVTSGSNKTTHALLTHTKITQTATFHTFSLVWWCTYLQCIYDGYVYACVS